MPIVNLDKQVQEGRKSYPVIGYLSKGAPKPESGNKPGADLPYWRFSASTGHDSLEDDFNSCYGRLDEATGEIVPPAILAVRLPAHSADGLSYWMEEKTGKKAQLLLHRCDGVTQQSHYDEKNKTISRQAIPCVASAGGCNCKHVAFLKVFLPDLIARSGIMGVVLMRTSSRIDVEHLVKFVNGLEHDLNESGIGLNAVDLLLSRVPDTINYQDNKGKSRSREYNFVKLSFDPDWLRAHIDLLNSDTPTAQDDIEFAENEPPANQDPRLQPLLDQLEARSERYLGMTAVTLYQDHIAAPLGLDMPLNEWLEGNHYDAPTIYRMVTTAIIDNRLPVSIYGVRSERRGESYMLNYSYGFDVLSQYGRDPFKTVFDKPFLDSWLIMGRPTKYKDIPFDKPVRVFLDRQKDGSSAIKTLVDSVPDSDPVADDMSESDAILQQTLNILEGDNDPLKIEVLNNLGGEMIFNLTTILGYENDAFPMLQAAIDAILDKYLTVDEGKPAPELPELDNNLEGMTIEQLKELAKREGINLHGMRLKATIIDLIQKG